jgi:formylglycine-generating enzyme required for sulfatase activity
MQRWLQYFGVLSFVLVGAWLLSGPSGLAPGLTAGDKPTAEHKNYVQAIPDTKVKFEMIALPGGTFLMGSPADEKGRKADEGPQHPVTVKPFWMGKCEVTWDEFDAYWKPESAKLDPKLPKIDIITRPTPPYEDETFGLGRGQKPVICITHHAAMEYCRWLSIKTGKAYRLATEAEWEYAARAGTKTAYFFGDDPKQLNEYAWFSDNSRDKTHEVGQKKPNPWGLYDIYGNVAEWCLDQYDKDYYARFPKDKPTVGPVNVPGNKRFSHVTRGGGWWDDAATCRSAARVGSNKDWILLDPQRPQSIWWLTSAENVGFRVVQAVEEQKELKGIRSKITIDSPCGP